MARPKNPKQLRAHKFDLKRYIASLVGDNAEECFELFHKIMHGSVQVPRVLPDGTEVMSNPTLDQRMESARFIAEHLIGKPTNKSEVSTTVSHEVDFSRLSMTELRQLEQLADKAKALEGEYKVK
jgi:hypothetical protein